MPKSFHLPPVAATAHNLLADFICSPVSMRADRFRATVQDLHGITTGGAKGERLNALNAIHEQRADMGDDDPWPWELPIYDVEAGLATVQVNGPLVKGYDPFICWWYGFMSTDRLQAALSEIAANANVRAVLLKLNTPGGVSTGMPETADQIVALDKQKQVYAFTSDMAASNGYRLAAACRAILTTRSAVLGSIGTYIALYDYSEYLKEMGIKLELFRDGALKGIGVMGKELSAEEKKFLQDCVDESGAVFKDFVRSQRPDVKDETMQGQWFSGAQAVTLGLADLIVLDEASVAAEIRAGIAA